MVLTAGGRSKDAAESELHQIDVKEPLVFVSSCNGWGKDIEATRKAFLFMPTDLSDLDQQESRLDVNVESRKHISFQIVSARSLWDWRIHPLEDGKASKELKCGHKISAQLTVGQNGEVAHGLNFRIREVPPVVIEIRVLVSRKHGISLHYKHKSLHHGVCPPRLDYLTPWNTHEQVGRLRLIGSFCRRRTDVQGLTFELQESSDSIHHSWRQHRLCLRMLHREIKFQIVSYQLGHAWRLCPKRHGSRGVIPRGDTNNVDIILGRKQDGHGRKYFKIRESFLTVVMLTVWLEVTADSTVGAIRVTYTVRDAIPKVAIGIREMQFPPAELSQMDLAVKRIAENPRLLEVIKDRLQAVAKVVNQEMHTTVLELSPPSPETPPLQDQTVAAMLMLLPSSLTGWPDIFHTYLRYHLLAPKGPRFAHMFVFIDETPDADDDDRVDEEEADDDEFGAGLARWLAESQEAAELRPLVTVLDGSGPACLQAKPSKRPPELDAKLRAAAMGGELVARQMLNMERSLELAMERGYDWLLCNLDADEAFLCNGGASQIFAAVPDLFWQVQVLNHEAVPQATGHATCSTNFFHDCTVFKQNPLLLMETKGRSEEQKRCMDFWGKRAAAAALEADPLTATDMDPSMRPSDGYFSAYFIGKAAVRVEQCYGAGVIPTGPHNWSVEDFGCARASSESACILHYANCQGADGFLRKYRARTAERWNDLKFHKICQRVYNARSDALSDLLANGLVLREGDEEELEAQIAAGVCMRITQVSDACLKSEPGLA